MLMLVCLDTAAEGLVEEYYRRATSGDAADRKVLADLLSRAETFRAAHPQDPDAWLTAGLIRAAYAKQLGVKGLSQLEKARQDLEGSIARDSGWRDGYAKAFLARLYMTVPPWPIAFGNDERAASLLREVVESHPASLAGNLYEGLRLLKSRRREEAAIRLEIADHAQMDCECPYWTGSLHSLAREGLVTIQPTRRAVDRTDAALNR